MSASGNLDVRKTLVISNWTVCLMKYFFQVLFIILLINGLANSVIKCPTSVAPPPTPPSFPGAPPPPGIALNHSLIQKIGTVAVFITTKSVNFNPYSLVDPYRQSTLFHEYILIGPGFSDRNLFISRESERDIAAADAKNAVEEIELVLYDVAANDPFYSWRYEPDLVHQNLEKEFLWAFTNSSGMLPFLTVLNTTFQKSFEFHTKPGDQVAYYLAYPQLFRSRETVPPFDVLIEFPERTRMTRTLKTLIDYQTFGLLRWRLSPADKILWSNLTADYEFSYSLNISEACIRNLNGNETMLVLCAYQKRFKRLENPCIKDMFILYTIRGDKGVKGVDESYTSVNRLFMVIPMIYGLLDAKGWYDLTDTYCSRSEEYQECGDPKDVVLTNDHLLILTDRGLWVSNSLNSSNANVSIPYSLKPLLKFTPIDPCGTLTHFNCSEVGMPALSRQTFRRRRLFYNPVCHLFQYPHYDDIVIIVFDHVTVSPDLSEERDVFTVLYATKPYHLFRILFHARYEYQTSNGSLPIKDLLGIFFNHHRRFFDVSILINELDGAERTIRFILPEPTEPDFQGYDTLSGLLSDGIREFEFPPTFHMTHLVVNPEPMDVFFLGDQLWIAEAASPFVYLSVPEVRNYYEQPSLIDSCSFNHPDRTYVCAEKSHDEILTGRVGVSYSPIIVEYDTITEFVYTVLFNLWPSRFRQTVAMLGHFVAGYSGKIMLWYMYDHNELVFYQNSTMHRYTKPECSLEFRDEQIRCFICFKLLELKGDGCVVEKLPDTDPKFRMLTADPALMKARTTASHGPLVPFPVDGDKVLLFEADIPTSIKGFIPNRNFLHDIYVGSIAHCKLPHKAVWNGINCAPFNFKDTAQSDCDLYIRHMKNLRRQKNNVFMDGFRSVSFAHVSKAFPMSPVPTDLVVLIIPDSNHAVIQLDNQMFEPGYEFVFRYAHIGQTLYIPQHFSILLVGFPVKAAGPPDHDMSRMVGLATRYYRQGSRIQVPPFKSFIVDFGTKEYCEFHVAGMKLFDPSNPSSSELVVGEYDARRTESNRLRDEALNPGGSLILDPPTYQELEDNLLKVVDPEIPVSGTVKLKFDPDDFKPPISIRLNCEKIDRWKIIDGGCHLRLTLVQNPVVKQGGGRISLDKFDSVSFAVQLHSLTPLGKSLMHRPLISITNSNPNILSTEKEESFGKDPQIMQVTLTPTGFKKGVATVQIRPVIVSTKCPFADGSFTLIVQVHRAEGRRLHINYPIPICKPTLADSGFERHWKIDLPTCVTREELLTKQVIRRPNTEYGQIFYKTLPENYRPPSFRGAEIPLSRNVYNVNPAAENYKDWYRISKETSALSQCFGRATRAKCDCSRNDELDDDVLFTDCKSLAYSAKRGVNVDISVEYDRVMRDSDQKADHFSAKKNWSVFLEEVNARSEYTVTSSKNEYLNTINHEAHVHLHEGRNYYDSKTLGVTLHGTGLFHFKVGLGSFESFDEVTGYFMIYCDDTELNHVQLVVIMLLTITVCMMFVFCGFLMVRNRLSTQLPFQTSVKNKIKLE